MKSNIFLFPIYIIAAISIAYGQPEDEPTPVGDTLTKAQTSDGLYISWREHLIDGPEIANAPINGGDGLFMADLDLDGYLDIVSVHESDTQYDGVPDGHIRVAFGSEDPDQWELGTLVDGPDAGAPEDVDVADLNGDGYPDVIAACELSHLVYLQNPGKNIRKSSWQRLVIPATKDRGSFIKVYFADLNQDGRPEVIAPNKGEQNPNRNVDPPKLPISIFQIKGNPLKGSSWIEYELGRYIIPQNSHPVDLDGDGDLDIVGGSRGERRIMWFENNNESDFAFKEHRIELDRGSVGGFNLAFADIDGDGRLDIICSSAANLVWLEQPAFKTGIWKMHDIGMFRPDSMTGLALADINGDGKLDAIGGSYSRGLRAADDDSTVNEPLGRIGWFEQPADPKESWIRHDISRRKRGMFDEFVARDMDGDGDIDFVSTRGNSAQYDGVFWLEQIRTKKQLPAFKPARKTESKEMPLPDTQ